jgi:hypothetical protein
VDKLVASPAAAVAHIGDGASIGIAGSGVAHRTATWPTEVARGFTPAEVAALTRMEIDVTGDIPIMQECWGD